MYMKKNLPTLGTFLRRRRRLGVLVTAGRKKMKAIWDAEAGVTGTRSFITRRKQVFLKKKGDSHWEGQRKLRRKGQEATNIYIALEERLNHTKKI